MFKMITRSDYISSIFFDQNELMFLLTTQWWVNDDFYVFKKNSRNMPDSSLTNPVRRPLFDKFCENVALKIPKSKEL